nr:uncharacterized protein LOC115261623 [Aedes albopictus]
MSPSLVLPNIESVEKLSGKLSSSFPTASIRLMYDHPIRILASDDDATGSSPLSWIGGWDTPWRYRFRFSFPTFSPWSAVNPKPRIPRLRVDRSETPNAQLVGPSPSSLPSSDDQPIGQKLPNAQLVGPSPSSLLPRDNQPIGQQPTSAQLVGHSPSSLPRGDAPPATPIVGQWPAIVQPGIQRVTRRNRSISIEPAVHRSLQPKSKPKLSTM